MTVHVRLFARFRDLFGTDVVPVEISAGESVDGLRSRLADLNPASGLLLARSQIAVNGELAANDVMLKAEDEIALIPPVSGG